METGGFQKRLNGEGLALLIDEPWEEARMEHMARGALYIDGKVPDRNVGGLNRDFATFMPRREAGDQSGAPTAPHSPESHKHNRSGRSHLVAGQFTQSLEARQWGVSQG
jgi:hypothetical protein